MEVGGVFLSPLPRLPLDSCTTTIDNQVSVALGWNGVKDYPTFRVRSRVVSIAKMLLLSAYQVRYCQVTRRNQRGEVEVIPGIAYYGKLFVRGEIFPIHQKMRAIEYSRQRFTEYEEQVYILIVEEADRLTLWYETTEVTPLATEDGQYFSDYISSIDLKQLVKKMRSPIGLPMKTKRRGFRTFRDCFSARDAINWLENNLQISRADAIRLGDRLRQENWIIPLNNQSLPFQESDALYRLATEG